ncbi:amidohydrolase family protein [Phenylobacterium sp.]|uniref:amidohydrolase family protein n=1 Tax=Phenylobacterium sp. TaxID=1871053 RepID=UPI002CFF24FE|nr:amidohydrolase family protein [Phenylobacterium sp.]HLZ73781.1 amidohydrolase family protein [Phenylobacterium sp.]
MKKLALLAACALFAVTGSLALPRMALAETWAIEHVTLIDGTGHAPQADMTVTVDGDRIASVGPSALAKSKGKVIDGHGKYLMPGLMDVHIHLHGGVDNRTDTNESRTAALASYIYSGVTTVYDAGNQVDNILPLRAAERAGKILSPRIFCTGNLITYPGSHGSGMAVNVSDFEKDKDKLDRQIAEQQPDIIKLTLEEEGWGARPMITLMPEQLLRDVIRYYNLHGIRTTIHVSSELRAEEAIFAGTDSLAHPVIQGPVSDSFVKLMGAKKTPFASTLTIGENYSRLAEHPEYLDQPLYAASFSPADRATLKTKVRAEYQARMWTAWMKLMTPVAEENIRKVWAAGGVVAAGTDQSSGPALQRELELLVAAGIKPFDVLTIATHNGAVLLGKADTLGSVEPGKLADLLLLNADPTASIENVKNIAFVMKAGQIIDESKLPLAGGPQKRRFTP